MNRWIVRAVGGRRTDTDAGSDFTAYVIHRLRPGCPFVGQRIRLRLMPQGFGYKPRESKNRQIQGDGVTIVAAQQDHVQPGETVVPSMSLCSQGRGDLGASEWSASIEGLRAIPAKTLSAQSFTCDMCVIDVQ